MSSTAASTSCRPCSAARPATPKGLGFKPLAGKLVEGATHEFYAWSDQDARRSVGHFDNHTGQFVVDRLAEHL